MEHGKAKKRGLDESDAKDEIAEQSDVSPILALDSALLKDVRVALSAKLGDAELALEEVLALKAGSFVPLDTQLNEPIELYLNQALIARGVIVAVGERYGVRIVEIAPAA